jgi:hypothetical protein
VFGAARTGSGHPLPPVLRALAYAAQLLYHAELAQRYGAAAAAAAAEAGGAPAAAGAGVAQGAGGGGSSAQADRDSDGQRSNHTRSSNSGVGGDQRPQQQLLGIAGWQQDPLVAAALAAGAAASPDELQVAQDTVAEVQVGVVRAVLASVCGGVCITHPPAPVPLPVTTHPPTPARPTHHSHTPQELLNQAVKHDVVVVLPCVPAAPPRVDAPQQQRDSWLSLAHAFAALTSAGACPCVVLPVARAGEARTAGGWDRASSGGGSGGGGGGAAGAAVERAPAAPPRPLSLAVFGHSRSDQRLLAVAERLALHAQVRVCAPCGRRDARSIPRALSARGSYTAGAW